MPGVVAFVGADDISGSNSVAFASPGAEEVSLYSPRLSLCVYRAMY
jgi:hypothetical protein